MAGLRGNVAWLLAQKQTAKGAAATISLASAYKMPFSGGNIAPVREVDNLAETDSSRDRGVSYVVTSGVEGSPEFYARDASAGFWLWAALGADAVSGTTNFTHAITPTNLLPYITVWRNIGDTLWEQYRDCKVSSLTIAADAGQPLQMTAGIQGLQATRLTATPDTAIPIPIQTGAVYNFNECTVTLAGGATALVSSFELTIENNVTRQQTDDVVPYDVAEGQREISLSFNLIFETLDEYNKFHYGGVSGTTISPTVFTTSAQFTFSKGVNNSIDFLLPSIAYTEFPIEPSPGGDPIVASVAAAGQRGASPIVTATVKNQVASY
jgi:Phage tail tube protein